MSSLIIEPEDGVDHPEVDLSLVVDHQLDDHVIEVLRGFEAFHHGGELVDSLLRHVEPLAQVEVVWEGFPEVEGVLRVRAGWLT